MRPGGKTSASSLSLFGCNIDRIMGCRCSIGLVVFTKTATSKQQEMMTTTVTKMAPLEVFRLDFLAGVSKFPALVGVEAILGGVERGRRRVDPPRSPEEDMMLIVCVKAAPVFCSHFFVIGGSLRGRLGPREDVLAAWLSSSSRIHMSLG